MPSLLLFVALLATAPAPAQDSVFQLSVSARPQGTLTIDLATGGVLRIHGTDAAEVRVGANLRGRDWRRSRVVLEPSAEGARLVTSLGGSPRILSTSHEFDVWVPRAYNLQIESYGGDLSISNMNGHFVGSTRGGAITLEHVTGVAQLTTRGGNIAIEHATLDGSVTTRGGSVGLVDVHGNVSTTPSPAGASSDEEPMHIETPSGAISLEALPNGGVLRTGYGNIEAGPASGSVVAITGTGDVNLRVDKLAHDDSVFVRSGTGRVVVELPREFAGELDLQSGFTALFKRETQIQTDWGLQSSVTPNFVANGGTPQKYVTLRTRIGAGGQRVVVRTTNGDIVIKRSAR